MTCDYLKDNGIPTLCFLQRVQASFVSVILPFTLYRIWRYRTVAKNDVSLTVFTATCRKLALYTSAIFSVICVTQFCVAEMPLTISALAITVLHYSDLRVQPQLVASTELLVWWVTETVLLASKYAAQPTSLVSASLAVLATATCVLEIYSSPWNPQGYEEASVFGTINMSFIDTMIRTAQERVLTADDFAGVPDRTSMDIAYAKFLHRFNEYEKGSRYRLIRALLTFHKWRLIILLLLSILEDVVSYSQPLLLSLFLKSLQTGKTRGSIRYESIYLALAGGGIQLATNVVTGFRQNVFYAMYQDTRTALMEAIYLKALNVCSDARQEHDHSKIMNLLNVDTNSVQMAYAQVSTLISAPISLIMCTSQLYLFLGNASLAAIPIYLLYLPYTSWSTRKQMRRYPESMAAKDARAKSTLGIMRNIRSLKLYAWEEPYEKRVFEDRRKELGIRRRTLKLRVALRTFSQQLNNIVLVAVFLAFLYFSGKTITPEVVFPALAMIGLVSEPLFVLPSTISEMGNAFASQTRILRFLEEPDEAFENYYRKPLTSEDNFETPLLEVNEAKIAWGRDDDSATAVMPLSLQLRRGDLCCVLGKVGTGKSALLKALCGQLYVKEGSITVKGTLAYASQEPWLQYRSLRENVLFGLKYDEEFYNATIRACDLESDIALFPEGDLTEIGEKGISLSGGQKARVALARAVYSRADVYILDDILSAVDRHVSNKLIKNLLSSEGLLGSKVIVLATHTAKSLKIASHLLCMARGGKIIFNGAAAQADTNALVSATGESLASSMARELLPDKSYNRHAEAMAQSDLKAKRDANEDLVNSNANFSPKELSRDEMLPDVPILRVYKRYLTAAGSQVTVLVILLMVLAVIFGGLITVWLTVWSDQGLSGVRESQYYIKVFLLIVIVGTVISSGAFYVFFGVLALRASQILHDSMIDNVVHTPMSFFERTPLGAIMNRFTGDIASLDESLPNTMYFFLNMLLTTGVNLALAVFGSPIIAAVLLPIFPKYNGYRKAFVPASRQLQKLMSAAQGPLLSHIEESIRGVTTVTVFGMKDQFIKGFESRGNFWAHTSFLRYALRRWLNTRTSVITASVTTLAMLSVVCLTQIANLPVSVAGIVLYGIRVAGMRLSRIIELWTQIEISVLGVERVFNYIDIPKEAPYHLDPSQAVQLDENWPARGVIEFSNYSTKYRPELEDILHDVNIKVFEREKIGVVGRTGAGKSTLTLALFRILEAASGSVVIDDVTTSKLGLFDLRSRLSIIPQEAQIFRGTLRQNIDPLETSDDTKLWRVLELCHLKDHFESGLDTEIFEGGENISRGQAQLICLGRALIRSTKILVLDEATASVDANTDSIVQSTIRREFKDRTIITIAHRLDTIMDSDKVLVLAEGRVVEFDSPQKLLEQKGAFYDLCNSEH